MQAVQSSLLSCIYLYHPFQNKALHTSITLFRARPFVSQATSQLKSSSAGGKMAVACEGQLLLLTQPANGPVPEPTVLGSVPTTEVLVDDNAQVLRIHVCSYFSK